MLTYPNIDPVALRIGPLAVHWYGIMYLAGFLGCWALGVRRARMPHVLWPRERVGDFLFYAILGVIVGGRVGYMLFYNLAELQASPVSFFRIWEGGMSFHGGLLGVVGAMVIYSRRQGLALFDVADFTAVLVPFGLFVGRIGNFINGELWGKPTDLPWGMVFPMAGDQVPRHPSQLYEALLEGVVLLAILWWLGKRPQPRMALSGGFLLLYGLFRFAVEFLRLPDAHIGYVAWGWLTAGQLLCVPMIASGLLLLWLAYRQSMPPAGRTASPSRSAHSSLPPE